MVAGLVVVVQGTVVVGAGEVVAGAGGGPGGTVVGGGATPASARAVLGAQRGGVDDTSRRDPEIRLQLLQCLFDLRRPHTVDWSAVVPGGSQDPLQGGHLGRLPLTEHLSQGGLTRRVQQSCHGEVEIFLEPLHRVDGPGPIDAIDLTGVVAGGGEVGLRAVT